MNIQCIPVIKAEFSVSLLQSSVSHDPLEIILKKIQLWSQD